MQAVKQCAWGVFLALLSFSVAAHPHSFIRLKTQVLAENGQFTGLKMRWTMDEITSADLLYDAGNAKPGEEIWKKLAAEVMANVLGQHYFTEVWHDGQKVKFLNRPTEYGMAREGHQAVLTFILPLAQPQPLHGQTYTFATFDPTYYVDMSYEHDSDASLSGALQMSCKVAVHTPKPGEEVLNYAQSLDKEDAPEEDMQLGKQFAQTVTLACQ
ncbi:ABC-type uncharacterized transport system, periplasmic component [Enterobacter sp. FY-07]|uniref:DUF1007 family protein n=1 Tax=Kosakonia oryzendophytica TaxID=1005665 RepID=UPI0007775797|nr:DUF1007 family protein [Kosakonia oryzendophytica]AMO47738.1 ABC-type uncharacterized transport system, periplasmic component [Enterobacter sp. FY-07]TDT58515.1 ABC-type uncharacterized transport system substrate-binding protein [Enterobacter sp. AG5470]WBT59431.1 DUF1007 family protein [Kosakonia oryzendophytica]